ncbi:MAG: hypothetical protein ABL927_14780 [Bdellovibrionales bacterium]
MSQDQVGEAWEAQVEKITGNIQIPEQLPVIEERLKLREIINDQTVLKSPSIFDEPSLPTGRLSPVKSTLGLDYE